jgi:hypothetical protein
MNTAASKINFDKAGFYFIALATVVVLGFWKSYFSLYFTDVANDYALYFHFHATMVSLWVVMLIAQPILIRKKQYDIHRLVGKFSYGLMPCLLTSILLVMNYTAKMVPDADLHFTYFTNGLSDALKLFLFYIIAVWKWENVNIHARAMICTGIAFIGPALVRFLFWVHIPKAYLVHAVIICAIIIILIVAERKQKTGRWIFPLLLAICLVNYSLVIFRIKIPALDPVAKWFVHLPLTPSPEVKDMAIPENEMDRFTGKWDEPYSIATYKKGNQLWMRFTNVGKADSSRMLYQGGRKFILDKYRGIYFNYKLKQGKPEAISIYEDYVYSMTLRLKR